MLLFCNNTIAFKADISLQLRHIESSSKHSFDPNMWQRTHSFNVISDPSVIISAPLEIGIYTGKTQTQQHTRKTHALSIRKNYH